jgi:adenosylcobinamide kinase/adenosylcobinamide-phosphate guanylyltransferase
MKKLILGGARSGKSTLAEQLAKASHKEVIYFATADRLQNDCAMDQRIQHHQQRRPTIWQTVESPLLLAQNLQQHARADRCLLVDCLTLWLSNCLFAQHDDTTTDQQSISIAYWSQEKQDLLNTLETLPGDIILVSNEVGQGIVPLGEINRCFVDESGFLHQEVAKRCDTVVFTTAGLPTVLKGKL